MSNLLFKNAVQYCNIANCEIIEYPALGHGTDGSVWQTSRRTAVKAFERNHNYQDERECYLRLKKANVTEVYGLAVPLFVDCQESLMVIEMTIVQRPYLLDFGKVYLDSPPAYQYDKQLIANWHLEVRELFENDASKVYTVLNYLEKFGIYYVDPKPANIRFGTHDGD